MPITAIEGGGMIATGAGIPMFQLLALKGRLALEVEGITFRGRTTYSIIKQEFGLKGNKLKVLEQFTKLVEKKGEEYKTSEAAAGRPTV